MQNDERDYRSQPVSGDRPAGHQQRPIVTLSPEADQSVQAVYPAENSEVEDDETSPDYLTPVRWQATEYIHREKDGVWFAVLAVVTVVLVLVALFIIRSGSFAFLIPVMAAALIVYARRPPHLIDYTLSRQGLHINDKLYPFSQFKSFQLVNAIDHYFVMLVPTKRFHAAVTINFPDEAGEAIVDMLASRLPMREARLDFVDRLIQKLRI